MESITKTVAKDSANWAINSGSASNETNIKITPNIAQLFGVIPNDNEKYDVSFIIFKEDFIKSLCCIFGRLPLAKSKTGKLVNFSQELFTEDMKAIDDFFGTEAKKLMNATLSKPAAHSLCLNFGSGNFPIREFLLEKHSKLVFNKDKNSNTIYVRVVFDSNLEKDDTASSTPIKMKLQQIFYGAPGTGKSHSINNATQQMPKNNVFRTTFHPDSDYSTFVGAYKPTKVKSNALLRMNLSLEGLAEKLGVYYSTNEYGKIGGIQKFCFEYYPYIDGEYMSVSVPKLLELAGIPKDYNVDINNYIEFCHLIPKQDENKITYEFVPQTFLKAYIKAWKNTSENVALVIEEINRGNCAQIFGDLFQLLDRHKGFSSYPINTDSDLKQCLATTFNEFDQPAKEVVENINNLYSKHYSNIIELIWKGEIMVLPSNLYIWATMNTSDQSLFPIDSAFKRRWDWNYVKIKNEEKGWQIRFDRETVKDEFGNEHLFSVDWWDFITKINIIITNMTDSADKQLGYFFCQAEDNIINADTFVSKVVFYLWSDVFKNYGFDDPKLFGYTPKGCDEQHLLSFPDFYTENGNVDESVAAIFINNVMNWKSTSN